MCDHLGGYSVGFQSGGWRWRCLDCGWASRPFAYQNLACVDYTRHFNKLTF